MTIGIVGSPVDSPISRVGMVGRSTEMGVVGGMGLQEPLWQPRGFTSQAKAIDGAPGSRVPNVEAIVDDVPSRGKAEEVREVLVDSIF